MIRFNFGGNTSVTVINGQVIGGENCWTEKFDKAEIKNCNNVDKVIIRSAFGDVNVSASNSSDIEAHFYGEATINGRVNFDVRTVNRELRITLEFDGNCFNGNLKLDVTVPSTKTFKVISVNSTSANVILSKNVSTEYLKVETQSGDLKSTAIADDISVSTMSGDVSFSVNARKDVSVKVSTMSGDISICFNNVAYLDLSARSMSGNVKNCYSGNDIGYVAYVNISTMSGDINL